ncbi:MAG: glycosyltransferase family 4 protein [Candidatus Omnitrophota bacterium]
MVLEAEFPPDIRVEKEVSALIGAGISVCVLSHKKYLKKESEETTRGGIRVRKVDFRGRNYLARKVGSLIFFLTFRKPALIGILEKFVDDFKIDVLHIHDLPMVLSGITVSRKKGIPVVADLHENYPYALHLWKNRLNWIKHPMIALRDRKERWLAYEGTVCNAADAVIATNQEMKERLVQTHGINPGKISVVGNVYGFEFGEDAGGSRVNFPSESFFVLYAGVMHYYKVRTAVEALSYLKQYQKIILMLVGRGNKESEKILKNLVVKHNLQNNIAFVPWQPLERLGDYIKMSSICLVPLEGSVQSNACSPHKLFQYMAMGKPVLASDTPSLQRIIADTKCGLIFRAGDAKDLAEKIKLLYEKPDLREELGANGKEAVLTRYNFREEGKKLVNLYERLLSG